MPPVATVRQTPVGIKLRDGHSTKITLAVDPDISFWEKRVTPPGVDGGDPIPQTTMHQILWRTQAPRQLQTLTDCTLTAAYDPAVFPQIILIVNVPTTITVKFSDGSTFAFYGYLRQFNPQECAEGEQPEAEIILTPTNEDPMTYAESGPVAVLAPNT